MDTVKLTDFEKAMLNGDHGLFKQKAIEQIVKFSNVLGAKSLCNITKATLFLGAHPYLKAAKSDNYDEIFSKMYLSSDKIIPMGKFSDKCFCQTCVAPCSQFEWAPLRQSKELFDKNSSFLEITKKAGASITGSCTPYLIGWLPILGENFVTTESHVVLLCNSVFGARGNSNGLEAAVWAAICGKAPNWGCHLPESRFGTHVFHIDTPLESELDWDLLGYAVGKKLPPHGIPVLTGNFSRPDLNKLKYFFSTLASASGAEMCHIVGVTPEAPTIELALGNKTCPDQFTITPEDIRNGYCDISSTDSADIQVVSLGCPHFSLEEIKNAAMYIKGKKFKKGVDVWIWTDYGIKSMADLNGYTSIFEEAGGKILTSSCPTIIGHSCLGDANAVVLNGAKQCKSVGSKTKAKIFYGTVFESLDAAVTGRWEARYGR